VERRRETLLALAPERGMSVEQWSDEYSVPGADRMLDRWLETPAAKRPTAAVCWNDIAAYDVLGRCLARRIKVPDDLAIVGFDGISSPAPQAIPLTTIRAPWREIARQAVSLLLDHAEERTIPEETVLPVEFVEGASA